MLPCTASFLRLGRPSGDGDTSGSMRHLTLRNEDKAFSPTDDGDSTSSAGYHLSLQTKPSHLCLGTSNGKGAVR